MLEMFLEKEKIYLQALNSKSTYPANSIPRESRNPKGSRSWSYKKEKEKNIRNVFEKRKHLLLNLKSKTNLPISRGSKSFKGSRNWSYKKEKEKNIRNILGERKHLSQVTNLKPTY